MLVMVGVTSPSCLQWKGDLNSRSVDGPVAVRVSASEACESDSLKHEIPASQARESDSPESS